MSDHDAHKLGRARAGLLDKKWSQPLSYACVAAFCGTGAYWLWDDKSWHTWVAIILSWTALLLGIGAAVYTVGALRHWNVSRRQKWAARIGCGVLAPPFLLGGIYVTVGWFGSVGWAFVSIVFVIISVYYFKSRSQEAGKQKQSRAGT